jgi:glycosyltransferase involved in cell wall biosynthesis
MPDVNPSSTPFGAHPGLIAAVGAEILPVTVIIPVFNREQSLERTLRSVEEQQHYRVAQTLVIDDRSTDNSVAVAEKMGYDVVQLPKNSGAAAARNEGLRLATTDWVSFLDSDDCWEPNLLATLWPHTDGHVLVSGSAVLYAGGRAVSLIGAGKPPGATLNTPLDVLAPENRIVTSSTLVRADLVSRLGGFKTSLGYSEDLDLWLRVLEHGSAWCDATPTIQYNRGPSSKSQDARGVDDARAGIVYSFAEQSWWRRGVVEQYLGGIYWDAARTALRGGAWGLAVQRIGKILRRPARVSGVARSLLRHGEQRRRLRSLLAAGDGYRHSP